MIDEVEPGKGIEQFPKQEQSKNSVPTGLEFCVVKYVQMNDWKTVSITQANKKICLLKALNIGPFLGQTSVAESENAYGLAKLALVFEMINIPYCKIFSN